MYICILPKSYYWSSISPFLLPRCACAAGLQSFCVSVCYHSSCSRVDLCCPSVVPTESARYFEGFLIVDFAKNALFKSYGVIYLAIGAAIYEVLFVFYSYPSDDTETVIFDHASLLLAITVVRAQLWWENPK